MRAIPITLDEETLQALDADEEVQRTGRSALFRALAREYLRRRQARRIRERYARAYGKDGGADPEWEGWEDQGAWPPWNEEPELPTACGGERTGWP